MDEMMKEISEQIGEPIDQETYWQCVDIIGNEFGTPIDAMKEIVAYSSTKNYAYLGESGKRYLLRLSKFFRDKNNFHKKLFNN